MSETSPQNTSIRSDEKIVGHKTMADGSHQPLFENEAKAIIERCEQLKAKRLADMPTDEDALSFMFQAWQRLQELGWKEAIYCPKDGSTFDVIEAGSTGIHKCHYEGKWPDGSWWVHADNDMWPSNPILWRKTPEAK